MTSLQMLSDFHAAGLEPRSATPAGVVPCDYAEEMSMLSRRLVIELQSTAQYMVLLLMLCNTCATIACVCRTT